MKHALLKMAHDLTLLVLWFLVSGLCSAGLLVAWRSKYSEPGEASAAAFVVCMIVGCGLAVLAFFLSKWVASALIPIHRKATRRFT